MIVGIGTDLIEQSRIKKACDKDAFLLRIFTEEEQQLIRTDIQKAGGCWAGKEAVVKAFGTGFSGIEPNEIAILREENGRPYVVLYGKAKQKAEELGIDRIHISISNTSELVNAVVVCECSDKGGST